MREIKAIIEPSLVQKVLEALEALPWLPDVLLSEVTSCRPGEDSFRGAKQTSLEIVVPHSKAPEVVEAIARAAEGSAGLLDGRILVTNVAAATDIRDIEAGVTR